MLGRMKHKLEPPAPRPPLHWECVFNLRGTEEVLCGRKLSDLEAQGKAVTPAPCASSLGGRYREGPREPFTVRRKEMKVQRDQGSW